MSDMVMLMNVGLERFMYRLCWKLLTYDSSLMASCESSGPFAEL
jgi:hypothetical protein